MLLGDRRCTATNRAGERCGRASALGQFVCDLHGAKAPLSKRAGKERLAMLAEPALEVLYRATRNAPPCEHCGRSDADRDPTAVRAATVILDRCGFGPQLKLEVNAGPDYTGLSIDEVIVKLETLLDQARALRDADAARALPDGAQPGAVDGYLMPEEDADADADAKVNSPSASALTTRDDENV